MLGFRYNDPNRPFVIGSLFNGTIGAGGSSNNNIKSIFTRTGSTITFDEGQSSILVKDPSGNTWFMDGKGNIEVTAPKNITMIAGEHVSITAGKTISNSAGDNFIAAAQKNVNIIAGESLTEIANDDYTLTASNIFETAQKARSSKAASLKVNVEKGDMVSTKDAIHVESAKEVNNNSGKKVKMQ